MAHAIGKKENKKIKIKRCTERQVLSLINIKGTETSLRRNAITTEIRQIRNDGDIKFWGCKSKILRGKEYAI